MSFAFRCIGADLANNLAGSAGTFLECGGRRVHSRPLLRIAMIANTIKKADVCRCKEAPVMPKIRVIKDGCGARVPIIGNCNTAVVADVAVHGARFGK